MARNMLPIIITLIFSYIIYRSLILRASTIKTLDWLEKMQSVNEVHKYELNTHTLPFIILLLPVLREQRDLSELISHVSRMQYPHEKLRVLIITTERERNGSAHKILNKLTKDTIQIAEEHTNLINSNLGYTLFFHIHYPLKMGNKASQMNFALDMLDNLLHPLEEENTYVGVYDADSRPDKRTLKFVGADSNKWKAKHGQLPPAYQQMSLYLKNFDCIENNFEGLILKADSLFQTRWAIAYEIPNFLKQFNLLSNNTSSILSKIFMSRLCYLIGHGCFIRLDILNSVEGFPIHSPIEDIALGDILSSLGTPIKPIPYFDFCEVPKRLSAQIQQAGIWFAGSAGILASIHFIHKKLKRPIDIARVTISVIKRLITNLSWGLGGIVFIFCMLSSLTLYKDAWYLIILGVVSGLLYSIFGIWLVISRREKLDSLIDREITLSTLKSNNFLLFLLAIILIPIIRCIGPMTYSTKWILSQLIGMPLVYSKTERS